VKLAVTKSGAADELIASYAEPSDVDEVLVRHSYAELERVARVSGEAIFRADSTAAVMIGVDESTNSVEITIGTRASEAARSAALAARDRAPATVVLEYADIDPGLDCASPHACPPPLRGGVGVDFNLDTQTDCTTGFVFRDNSGVRYVSTAGHCGAVNSFWRHSSTDIGPMTHSVYQASLDYGLIRVNNNSFWNTRNWVRIDAGWPGYAITGRFTRQQIGQNFVVCRTGSISSPNTACGVQVTNTCIQGQNGLPCMVGVQVSACPGDSGGPYVANNRAVLIHSSSSDQWNCNPNETSFGSAVSDVEAHSGVALLTI